MPLIRAKENNAIGQAEAKVTASVRDDQDGFFSVSSKLKMKVYSAVGANKLAELILAAKRPRKTLDAVVKSGVLGIIDQMMGKAHFDERGNVLTKELVKALLANEDFSRLIVEMPDKVAETLQKIGNNDGAGMYLWAFSSNETYLGMLLDLIRQCAKSPSEGIWAEGGKGYYLRQLAEATSEAYGFGQTAAKELAGFFAKDPKGMLAVHKALVSKHNNPNAHIGPNFLDAERFLEALKDPRFMGAVVSHPEAAAWLLSSANDSDNFNIILDSMISWLPEKSGEILESVYRYCSSNNTHQADFIWLIYRQPALAVLLAGEDGQVWKEAIIGLFNYAGNHRPSVHGFLRAAASIDPAFVLESPVRFMNALMGVATKGELGMLNVIFAYDSFDQPGKVAGGMDTFELLCSLTSKEKVGFGRIIMQSEEFMVYCASHRGAAEGLLGNAGDSKRSLALESALRQVTYRENKWHPFKVGKMYDVWMGALSQLASQPETLRFVTEEHGMDWLEAAPKQYTDFRLLLSKKGYFESDVSYGPMPPQIKGKASRFDQAFSSITSKNGVDAFRETLAVLVGADGSIQDTMDRAVYISEQLRGLETLGPEDAKREVARISANFTSMLKVRKADDWADVKRIQGNKQSGDYGYTPERAEKNFTGKLGGEPGKIDAEWAGGSWTYHQASKLLSRDFFGAPLFLELNKTDIVIVHETKKEDHDGMAYWHSNVISMTDLSPTERTEEDWIKTAVHEAIHIIIDMSYQDKIKASGVMYGYKKFWNEGMTEFFTQQICRMNGIDGNISYEKEVEAVFLLKWVAGEFLLREAFLNGDFTRVESAVDFNLGKGSFKRLMSCKDAAEAIVFLGGRLDEKGIHCPKFNFEDFWK